MYNKLYGTRSCLPQALHRSFARQRPQLTGKGCASWRVQGQQQAICCRLLLCHTLQQLLDVSNTADLQAA